MALDIDTVFRDNVIKGDINSGANEPDKSEIRSLLKGLVGGASNPSIVKTTKAALDAITPASENYGGMVLNDPDPTKNGYYSRVAAAWVRQRGFPDSVAILENIGGTANAITADTADGVDPATVQMIILGDPLGTNSAGAATITLNGVVYAIKSASGTNLAAGDVIEGVGTAFFKSGAEWRQLFSSATGASFDHQGDWSAVVTYTEAQVVTGSNGNWYQLKVPSALNDNPVSGGSGNWLLVLTAGALADGAVTEPKHATGGVSTRALADGSVTDDKVASGIDAAKMSFTRSGTGMVAQNVYSYIAQRARSPFDANPGLGAVNDTSVNARADNKASFELVLAQREVIGLPIGSIYLPADAALPWNPGVSIIGLGHHGITALGKESGSAIRGDGNIFFTDLTGTGRSMKNFTLSGENLASYGQLVRVDLGGGVLTDVDINDMYFYGGTRHLSVFGGYAVNWRLHRNIWEAASGVSRYFTGTTVHEDFGYSKGNASCVQMDEDGLDHHYAKFKGVMEGTTGTAMVLKGKATGTEIDVWFEGNGLTGGSADITINPSVGPVNGTDLTNSRFQSYALSTQTVRVDIAPTGTGTVGTIWCGPGFVQEGAVPLSSNTNRVHIVSAEGFSLPQSNYQIPTYGNYGP